MENISRKFTVHGLAPAISKEVNDFMKSCGLGGEGAFVVDSNDVTIKLSSHQNIDILKDKLKEAYETKLGWTRVTVTEHDFL